ncbi:hypothetical protein ACFXTN_034025 [Malus domestica]
MAQDMTFENTTGPEKHQAIAMRYGTNQLVFYRCSFKGYQDTLYAKRQSQFYRDSEIYYFRQRRSCAPKLQHIRGKTYEKSSECGEGLQSREQSDQSTGIVIHNCHVTAAEDLRHVQHSFRTYLGWSLWVYPRTVIMKSTLNGLVDPTGRMLCNGSVGLSTLYYGEYMNFGGGADTCGRVKLLGYHVIRSTPDAKKFIVRNFISGDSWISRIGVPFQQWFRVTKISFVVQKLYTYAIEL